MSALHTFVIPAFIAAILTGHAPAHAQDPGLQSPEVRPAVQPYEITTEGALRRELARGVYQAVYSNTKKSLYIASAELAPDVNGGLIYRLDPSTLATTGLIHTDEKNFGLATDPDGDTLFVTHSLAGTASKIDLASGKVVGRIEFEERSADGSAYGPREILHDAATDTVYVGGVGDPGRIWVIDARDWVVRTSIPDAGKWVTGLLSDPRRNRLYAANGDGEVLVIDTRSHTIQQRWKPAGQEPALLLNLALDESGDRLFVTDHSKLKTVLAVDTRTGKLINRLPVGESLDILYQPGRNALYLSHRDRGMVSIVDATSFQVRKQYRLPPNPNSLLLSPEGDALFVTIKTPFTPDHFASGFGSIARIDLP